MHFTTFEGKKIASFLQKGEGLTHLFIHGFCQDSSVWDDFILRFPGRTILRIDLPGFGQSEQIDQYSITRFADVVAQVLDDRKIEKCIFFGHSMGGYVGLEFAKKYGERLDGFCLFHSNPFADTEEKKTTRKRSIKFIQDNGHIYYVKQLMPVLFPQKYATGHHLELAKLVFKASKYQAENIIAGLEIMMERKDNTSVLSTIQCPVLFIIGKEDTVVPEYLEETALPNISSIHVLKDIGHMGMLESPKQCEKIIKSFVSLVAQSF